MKSQLIVRIVAPILVFVVCLVFLFWWAPFGPSREEVRQIVTTTIQREAAASFLVTGYIETTASVTVSNTRYLFPGMFDFNLGTTSTTVRVPGKISYGFDLATFRADRIAVQNGGVVEVYVPEIVIYSVEPDLDRLEMKTEVGWARSRERSGQNVQSEALRYIKAGLTRQGRQYISSSQQPRIHTARALDKMIRPALQAAGIRNPKIRFRILPDLVLEPEG